MTSPNKPPPSALQAALIAMMKAGQCTQAEAARMAGRSRQSVADWIPGIDTTAARAAWLAKRLELRLRPRPNRKP
jgi:hypothetical protein